MSLKDRRARVLSSGPKTSSGRMTVRYHGPFGRHYDALVMGAGVIGSAPTGLTPSTNTSGGTLAAGTYFYRVSAVVNFTETALAAEQSQVTTGSTSTVTLNWNPVAGATSYKVYGRATGAELFMATVPAGTTQFTDTGSITPAGAIPTGTLGLKLKVGGANQFAWTIDNVPVATSMHSTNSYYTVFG